MANLNISDKLDNALQQAADRLGKSKDEYASEALEHHLEEQAAAGASLTPAQIERMRKSLAQLERGEVVTSEEVDLFFEDWQKEIAAR